METAAPDYEEEHRGSSIAVEDTAELGAPRLLPTIGPAGPPRRLSEILKKWLHTPNDFSAERFF